MATKLVKIKKADVDSTKNQPKLLTIQPSVFPTIVASSSVHSTPTNTNATVIPRATK